MGWATAVKTAAFVALMAALYPVISIDGWLEQTFGSWLTMTLIGAVAAVLALVVDRTKSLTNRVAAPKHDIIHH